MIENWEIQMVKQAYENYRLSASILEKLIVRDYSKHISHRTIHKILLALGYAKKKDKKKKND